ncbi:MAG TPA: bifunctional UDP-N-acetylglucosamine diphosphorylase/glucosamine-1-phosphate N-acetyltransferase GlmU [Steroidobacteraceae bacterium]|nr:bifunctional UDP-N-acetylglucosamine diphosphorylase/glucosamine-1-phosphate N-acetyltransferase GlmU [Steroidobacteraceae bacterium]
MKGVAKRARKSAPRKAGKGSGQAQVAAAAALPPVSVVVLAAGQGKRMNSGLPKVLQPLAGRPLLRHVLDTARELQPAGLHVVHGHGGAQVQAAFAGEPVTWALQAEQKGTGHAVMQAMPAIPDDHLVLVLYGDVPLLRASTLRSLVALAGNGGLALLTVQLADPTGYGRVVRDARGSVKSIVEDKDASAREKRITEGNTGVMALPAGRLRQWLGELKSDNAQGEYYLTDVVAMAVKARMPVRPLTALQESEVLGVNDRLQLAQLEGVLRGRNAEEALRAGATLADPARFDQRGQLALGRDVFIDVNAVFEGRVVLGDRVRIGPNCLLRDVTIGADTQVLANSVLERSEVGAGCHLGPFARLRPGNVLADGVHVGNFVEVKNSRIGRGTKANHLTYLGDADVGEKVNVGAGTITCNYDGANKSRTVIGDQVFIGSGNMLVAPVSIGANATTGAGSTITRDAPPGQLTLARGRQVTIEGWQRPVKKKVSQE